MKESNLIHTHKDMHAQTYTGYTYTNTTHTHTHRSILPSGITHKTILQISTNLYREKLFGSGYFRK